MFKNVFSSDDLHLELLLPKEKILHIEEINKGYSCKKYLVTTTTNQYVLRTQYKKEEERFALELKVTQAAGVLKIGPQLVAHEINRQQLLLEYISCQKWPSFEDDSKPYCNAMQLLKTFHENAEQHIGRKAKIEGFSPFSLIIDRGSRLKAEVSSLPKHFALAIEKTDSIFNALLPWLQQHATYCHGDLHQENALYSGTRVFLIDWETISWGDPIFDVVKFSLLLSKECRIKLYSSYLGHDPTGEEMAHFELIDIAFLMVVVVNRMHLAYSQKVAVEELLSQEEAEQLLNNPSTLPSFLTVTFADTSLKARQKGAIYALGEFLQRTNKQSTFAHLLQQFNS